MEKSLMKVGALAKKTGLTVRALHYYEEVGLLTPAERSEKGYRLYGIKEVKRLQQILSLQQLGFPLEEIRQLLEHQEYSLQKVVNMHVARLEEKLVSQLQLLFRLRSIAEHLENGQQPSIEDFIETIKVTIMHEKYYTPEQLDTLKERSELLGDTGMQQAQQDWENLNNAFREAMENGTDPADESVQALVARMQELIQAFTGGDAGIENSLGTMYQQEGPEAASRGAVDQALFDYIGKARQSFQR